MLLGAHSGASRFRAYIFFKLQLYKSVIDRRFLINNNLAFLTEKRRRFQPLCEYSQRGKMAATMNGKFKLYVIYSLATGFGN